MARLSGTASGLQDPADVLAGVPGDVNNVGLTHLGVSLGCGNDRVRQFAAAPVQQGFGAAVGPRRFLQFPIHVTSMPRSVAVP